MNNYVPKNKAWIKDSELKAKAKMTEEDKIKRAQRKMHQSPAEALASQAFKELDELQKERNE